MAASWLRAHRVRPGGGAPVKTVQVQGPKWMLDVAGHYARPDVFELVVRTETRPMLVVRKRVPAALGKEAAGHDMKHCDPIDGCAAAQPGPRRGEVLRR